MNEPPSFWPTIRVERDRHVAVVDSFIIAWFLDRERCDDPAPVVAACAEFISGIGKGGLNFYIDDEGESRELPPDAVAFVEQDLARQHNSGRRNR